MSKTLSVVFKHLSAQTTENFIKCNSWLNPLMSPNRFRGFHKQDEVVYTTKSWSAYAGTALTCPWKTMLVIDTSSPQPFVSARFRDTLPFPCARTEVCNCQKRMLWISQRPRTKKQVLYAALCCVLCDWLPATELTTSTTTNKSASHTWALNRTNTSCKIDYDYHPIKQTPMQSLSQYVCVHLLYGSFPTTGVRLWSPYIKLHEKLSKSRMRRKSPHMRRQSSAPPHRQTYLVASIHQKRVGRRCHTIGWAARNVACPRFEMPDLTQRYRLSVSFHEQQFSQLQTFLSSNVQGLQ